MMPMTAVVANTTAMSVPHEVEYTLTFASRVCCISTRRSGGNGMAADAGIAIVLALVVAAVSSMRLRRFIRSRRSIENEENNFSYS